MKERGEAGFTLVEVLLMILIGIILAGAALPNIGTLADLEVSADARVLAADMEFARARALATSQPHRLSFDTTLERYAVESPVGTPLLEPLGKQPWVRMLSPSPGAGGGTDIVSADFAGAPHLDFDPAGRPLAAGTVVLHRGAFSASVSIAAVTGEVSLELP